ncbi:purine-cytosine permease family protein [Amycolatopsis sp. A1MSW2902]|uniref:purine-cytosine permease family protein n=1 Tax=Amycolatopsis sp. A1MSW2902 TaxID=687413 RepID=UPI00307F5A5F
MKNPTRQSARVDPVNEVGRIETRGIEPVPDRERRGRARQLFPVWLSSNLAYLYILLGGTLTVLGLSIGQAMLVLVAGNLFWVLVGLLAASGVPSGAPSSVVMRAMFGVRGNRVVGSGLGWLTAVGFGAINLSITAMAGLALLGVFGADTGSIWLQLLVLAVVGVATFAVSVYGHATILHLSKYFGVLLAVCLAILAAIVVSRADFSHLPAPPEHGTAAALLAGFTVIASGPVSWLTGADYARYLPRSESPAKAAWWTGFGGALPALVLGGIGVLAGTVVDMADPQTSMAAILPRWFYPVFLVAVLLGTLTNNVSTFYSSGLMLQAVGLRAPRARTVLLDAAVGLLLTAYMLMAPSFLTALNNILTLAVTYLGPVMAIYAVDLVRRRNRYDGPGLADIRSTSPFWFRNGVNWQGCWAFAAGTGAALLCASTTLWQGPVSVALGGVDLSAVVGPIVGGALYAVLYREPGRDRY